MACRGLAVGLGVILASAVIELGLRVHGDRPWAQARIDPRIPILFEADPTLGWRAKPGRYVVPSTDGSAPRRVTILADRSRDTGAPENTEPTVAFLGCSLTFGWGVSDDETFVWRIQQKHPQWHIANLGVPAYGTYQSYLRLEQLLASGIRPKRVLYGYMQGHELRNVAHPLWTLMLEKYSTQGMVSVPYAQLGGGGHLIRRDPVRYPAWPLRNYLASVVLLEKNWALAIGRQRVEHWQEVSDRILLDMANLCQENGIEFAVVILEAEAIWKDHYRQLLGPRGIALHDCALALTPELTLPRDGHPNARAHAIYADCIDRRLGAPPDSLPIDGM